MSVWQGTPIHETNRPGWSVQRDSGQISYENISIAASETMIDGTPISKVVATGAYVPFSAEAGHELAGILWGTVYEAPVGQTRSAKLTARLAELVSSRIVWPADPADKLVLEAQLKAAFLIVR